MSSVKQPTVIGVDLSITSPGLAVWNPNVRQLSLYFIPQRKREYQWKYNGLWSLDTWRRYQEGVMQHIQNKKANGKSSSLSRPIKYISISGKEEKITLHDAAAAAPPSFENLLAKPVPPSPTFIPNDPNDKISVTLQALPHVHYDSKIHTKEYRFHHVVESLFTVIDPLAKEYPIIMIEGHAMAKDPRLFTYTIEQHEMGGLFRHRLFRVGLSYIEMSPKSIKMAFTGSGDDRIGKMEMLKQFLEMGVIPDIPDKDDPRPYLFRLFNLTYPPKGEVQHPVQDFVDSMAILQAVYLKSFLEMYSKAKPKKTTKHTKQQTNGKRKTQKNPNNNDLIISDLE